MSHIVYKINAPLTTEQVIEVFKDSGINRPVDDPLRIQTMFERADLVVSAWHQFELVGLARSLSDFAYCTYLSDLAVKKDYQKQGIGKKLIELSREQVTEKSMLLLLAAPQAVDYYPHIKMFEKMDQAFLIRRES